MQKLPVRLKKDPILEAIFEVRFRGTVPAVAEVLQGALYPSLKDRFPNVQRTAIGNLALPSELLEGDSSLRYQPRLILRGDQLSVFIGDHAVALMCPRPYVGWKSFLPLILELLGYVKGTGVVGEPERFSLKYINLLEGPSPAAQYSLVHYDAVLGQRYRLNNLLTYTRTEFEQDGLTNIVELGANSVARSLKGESFKGLVVTVDTICKEPKDFWTNPGPHIDKVHNVEKDVFFHVLTEETINKMEPVWS